MFYVTTFAGQFDHPDARDTARWACSYNQQGLRTWHTVQSAGQTPSQGLLVLAAAIHFHTSQQFVQQSLIF